MIERRKIPWGMFGILLAGMCAVAYLLCGLLKIPGVTLTNYQAKLLYIVTHPLQNWWTQKTPIAFGGVFVIWIMVVAWYTNYYRNTHLGAENGTEQWGDIRKLSKTLRDKDENKNIYLSQNIAVSDTLLSNRNMLIIGGSGSYKTTSVVTPNLLRATGSNVILDIKGDLLRKHGNYLKKHGVKIRVLNLINPEESDRYNPFRYIEKETDLIKLITNIQAAVKPSDAAKGDPFWDDGVALYLQAMFYHEWLQGKMMEPPDDVVQKKIPERESKNTDQSKEWDLSGSIFDCIKRYSFELTDEQLDEIILGLEEGLSENEVKSYFQLSEEEMRKYRKVYMFYQI